MHENKENNNNDYDTNIVVKLENICKIMKIYLKEVKSLKTSEKHLILETMKQLLVTITYMYQIFSTLSKELDGLKSRQENLYNDVIDARKNYTLKSSVKKAGLEVFEANREFLNHCIYYARKNEQWETIKWLRVRGAK